MATRVKKRRDPSRRDAVSNPKSQLKSTAGKTSSFLGFNYSKKEAMTLNTESTRTTCLVVANENNNLSEAKTKKDSKRSIEEHFEQLEQTIFVEGLTSEVSTVLHPVDRLFIKQALLNPRG